MIWISIPPTMARKDFSMIFNSSRIQVSFLGFYNLDNVTAEELSSKYMWAHLTCAYWLPECFFTADNKITGLPNVEKKRFNLTCIICKIKSSLETC